MLAGIMRIEEFIDIDKDVVGQTHRRLMDSSCLKWEEKLENPHKNNINVRKC